MSKLLPKVKAKLLVNKKKKMDEIGGTILGFVKGFFYCVLLCWFLGFLGSVLGKTTLYNTTLARFFMAFEFITNGLL